MPIYNPTAGGGGINVYESNLAYLNGYDFFTSIGILDNTFTELFGYTTTIGAFDGSVGTAMVIDNSVALSGAPSAHSMAGWDFAVKDEVLVMAWGTPSLSGYFGVGINESTLPAGAQQDDYQSTFQTTSIQWGKHVGGAFTVLASDLTIGNNMNISNMAKGIALYVNGATNEQQIFMCMGGFWFHVLTTNDAEFTTFQSVYLRYQGQNARAITPIFCWGK